MGTAAFALSAFFVGWFFSPLLTTYTTPGTLDDVQSWALQGPGREIPTPLMGLYVFRGLNPSFLADLSYAHSWSPKERSFLLDMSGPGYKTLPRSNGGDFSGEFALTSPVAAGVNGITLKRFMACLRHQNKFTMNEEGTRAIIHPVFFFEWFPLGFLARAYLREEIELHKNFLGGFAWKRVNYSPPNNATQTDAHYWLHPVVTINKGSVKVHAAGKAMAKRKLKMSKDETFIQ